MPDAGFNGHCCTGPRALGAAARRPDDLGVRAGALFLALCYMFHPAASAASNRTQLAQLLLGGSYNPTQPPAQEGLEVRRPKCVMEASSPPFNPFLLPPSGPYLSSFHLAISPLPSRGSFVHLMHLHCTQVQVQFALINIVDVSTENEHIELQACCFLVACVCVDQILFACLHCRNGS